MIFADHQGTLALKAFFDLTDVETEMLFDCDTYDESAWTSPGAVASRIEFLLRDHVPEAARTPGSPLPASQLT